MSEKKNDGNCHPRERQLVACALRSWAIRQVRLCSFEKIQVLYTVLAKAVSYAPLATERISDGVSEMSLGTSPVGRIFTWR
jgi:hypothetical protein